MASNSTMGGSGWTSGGISSWKGLLNIAMDCPRKQIDSQYLEEFKKQLNMALYAMIVDKVVISQRCLGGRESFPHGKNFPPKTTKVTRGDDKGSSNPREQSPHDLVTWGRGYAYMSTPSNFKWVPAKWVKPFIPKTHKATCRSPTSGQCCLEKEKAPNPLLLIILFP
ncbi:hypothetical protein DUI87_00790 [Hirundo rustica rustica]|uniref:Integrase-type domain-containing protein n=1 Tax=Hirundo rustica rustica TaxID=333673 RepID=A0A3M0LBN5_HIRRU|nr:hypothetical protein DUI87_00790 [Hirundo rustica rustica]